MHKRGQNTRTEKGQSLIELAISLTFLLILLAGLVDLGRAIFYYLTLRDAVQEGVVYGVVYPTFCSQIDEIVKANTNDESVNVTVMVDNLPCNSAGPSHACADKEIRVIGTQPNFHITMPLLGTFIGTQNLSLEAEIKGTILRPACP